MRRGELSDAPTTPAADRDADLVAQAQRGGEAAFRALFDANKRRVYSLCLRMTGDSADAEDLTQETFLKAFRKISTFRGESTFSTWLHRLAVNEVLMFLRRKRLPQVSLEEVDTSQEEPVARQFGNDDRRLRATIDRIHLSRAIAHLPPGARTAVVLFDLEGYDHREIAQITNRSVGNSKSQLHKARRKLRDWLRMHSVMGGSLSGSKLSPKCEAKESPALRDITGAPGVNRLEPRILTR
jgi:RNA polymerase sigma-70 factor, ECF subfamily